VFGYAAAPSALTEAVVSTIETSYGLEVMPEWIVWLPGVVSGLNLCCRILGEDQDEVLSFVPIYPPFLAAPALSRRTLVTMPMELNGGRWIMDFDRMEKAITPRTRLLLLCSPHNPAGRAFTREELSALADICLKKDIVICSDEIHCGLVLDEDKKHIPTAVLNPEVADRTITLMAPSKTYNLPGFGCSLAIIPNVSLRRQFRKAMSGIVPHLTALSFTAALAAYRDGQEWLDALLVYLRGNRDIVAQAIRQIPGLRMTHVEATYLAWIDTSAAGLDDPGKFFEEAGVGLSDGRDFAGPGFVRLNFGCPRVTLTEALSRMKQAIAGDSEI